jgi:hypothetical protein
MGGESGSVRIKVRCVGGTNIALFWLGWEVLWCSECVAEWFRVGFFYCTTTSFLYALADSLDHYHSHL